MAQQSSCKPEWQYETEMGCQNCNKTCADENNDWLNCLDNCPEYHRGVFLDLKSQNNDLQDSVFTLKMAVISLSILVGILIGTLIMVIVFVYKRRGETSDLEASKSLIPSPTSSGNSSPTDSLSSMAKSDAEVPLRSERRRCRADTTKPPYPATNRDSRAEFAPSGTRHQYQGEGTQLHPLSEGTSTPLTPAQARGTDTQYHVQNEGAPHQPHHDNTGEETRVFEQGKAFQQ